jgi:hypothetical protein
VPTQEGQPLEASKPSKPQSTIAWLAYSRTISAEMAD